MGQMLRAISTRNFRFLVADSTDMVETMRKTHESSRTATAAMGRLGTITALLGMEQKNGESLTISFRGDGPGGNLIAVCDIVGEVRVSAGHPQAEVPPRDDGHLDVGAWVGHQGTLSLVRGAQLREPFIGITEIVSGEIAEDLASYYYYSEQTPTVVLLGVLVDREGHCERAGGLFIQALPEVTEEELDAMQQAVDALPPMTELLASVASEEHPLSALLMRYFPDFAPEALETMPLIYRCRCSHERIGAILATLPLAEREALAAEGDVEVVCEFCHTKHRFRPEELLAPPKKPQEMS